jgi:hypothetical protein
VLASRSIGCAWQHVIAAVELGSVAGGGATAAPLVLGRRGEAMNSLNSFHSEQGSTRAEEGDGSGVPAGPGLLASPPKCSCLGANASLSALRRRRGRSSLPSAPAATSAVAGPLPAVMDAAVAAPSAQRSAPRRLRLAGAFSGDLRLQRRLVGEGDREASRPTPLPGLLLPCCSSSRCCFSQAR